MPQLRQTPSALLFSASPVPVGVLPEVASDHTPAGCGSDCGWRRWCRERRSGGVGAEVCRHTRVVRVRSRHRPRQLQSGRLLTHFRSYLDRLSGDDAENESRAKTGVYIYDILRALFRAPRARHLASPHCRPHSSSTSSAPAAIRSDTASGQTPAGAGDAENERAARPSPVFILDIAGADRNPIGN